MCQPIRSEYNSTLRSMLRIVLRPGHVLWWSLASVVEADMLLTGSWLVGLGLARVGVLGGVGVVGGHGGSQQPTRGAESRKCWRQSPRSTC